MTDPVRGCGLEKNPRKSGQQTWKFAFCQIPAMLYKHLSLLGHSTINRNSVNVNILFFSNQGQNIHIKCCKIKLLDFTSHFSVIFNLNTLSAQVQIIIKSGSLTSKFKQDIIICCREIHYPQNFLDISFNFHDYQLLIFIFYFLKHLPLLHFMDESHQSKRSDSRESSENITALHFIILNFISIKIYKSILQKYRLKKLDFLLFAE